MFPQFPLSLRSPFWSDAAVKFAVLLLALFAFSLTACNTLVTRRALYSPAKASGPYTKYRYHGGRLPPTAPPPLPAPAEPKP